MFEADFGYTLTFTPMTGKGGVGKGLLLDRVRQGLKTLCFGDKIGVVLETLLDTPIFGVGADDGGGGRQEGDDEADGVVGANGKEVFEDDRGEIVHCRVA